MIIAIGGISRAGKTTLANALRMHLVARGKSVTVLSQDNFVKPAMSLVKIDGYPDWERPNSIKWDLLTTKAEKSVTDYTIVEGLFAYYPATLRSMYDKQIFLELDKDVFVERKSLDTRWDDEPEWYSDHVWRSFQRYGQFKGDREDCLFLDGAKHIDIESLVRTLSI